MYTSALKLVTVLGQFPDRTPTDGEEKTYTLCKATTKRCYPIRNRKGICTLCTILITVTIYSCALKHAYSQPDSFILEAQQHWDTYGVGGTCISGSNNLFIGNIDNDGCMEIVTGGFSYTVPLNGTRASWFAPLKIWTWNGKNMTLEASHSWAGNINSVFAADIEGDGTFEIFTSGNVRNASGTFPSICIWDIKGKSMTLRSIVTGISATALFVCDTEGDGTREIISVGRFNNTNQIGARLCVWHLQGDSFKLAASTEWCSGNTTVVNSVVAHDLDRDGKLEIITGGYSNHLSNSSGQLRIWQFENNILSLKANQEWRQVEGAYNWSLIRFWRHFANGAVLKV